MSKWVITYEDLRERLLGIDRERYQAFLCLTYGTLGRVGEIVRSRYSPGDNPAITKSQLELDGKYLKVTLITEKTGNVRIVPINREKEAWLVDPILSYVEPLEPDSALFDWSTFWGEKLFKRYFGTWKIHLLRSWRATHLLQGKVTGEALPIQVVRRMGGWKNIKVLSETYDQTVTEDYLELI